MGVKRGNGNPALFSGSALGRGGRWDQQVRVWGSARPLVFDPSGKDWVLLLGGGTGPPRGIYAAEIGLPGRISVGF